MIVDDDFMVVESTKELLEDDYLVKGYVDARDSLEELKRNKYDLLILDYLMEQFNGDVFIEELRKFDKEIFIILYTGQADLVPPLKTVRSYHIQGYVEKGDASKLLLAVETSIKALQQVETIKGYNIGLNKIINLSDRILKIQTFEEIISNSAYGLLDLFSSKKMQLVIKDIIERKIYKVDISESSIDNLSIERKDCETLNYENYESKTTEIIKISTIDGDVVGFISINETDKISHEVLDIIRIFSMQIGLSISNSVLYNKSIIDGLTKIYNRMFLEQYMELLVLEAARYNKKFSFLLIDIDCFKSINDAYGYLCGDEILIYLSNTIKNMLRKSDMVARYGSEEFAVILKECDKDTCTEVAEKIRRQVENNKLNISHKEIDFTVSIGCTNYTPNDDKSKIIRRANDALCHAKRTGRNKCIII